MTTAFTSAMGMDLSQSPCNLLLQNGELLLRYYKGDNGKDSNSGEAGFDKLVGASIGTNQYIWMEVPNEVVGGVVRNNTAGEDG